MNLSKKRTAKTLSSSVNQGAYIGELEQRMVIPSLTHLYLTNRSSNYSEAITKNTSSYPVAIHVKAINDRKMNKALSIEIIYDNKLVNEKEMLLLALETIKANSQLSISFNARGTDSKKEDVSADLIFQLGETEPLKNKRNKVLVKPVEQDLKFTQSNGYDKTWNYSSPIDLINILSHLINDLDEVSETEILDEKKILRFFYGENRSESDNKNPKSYPNLLHPQFLQPYLIFLFCFFLLLERWMVLHRVKSHE